MSEHSSQTGASHPAILAYSIQQPRQPIEWLYRLGFLTGIGPICAGPAELMLFAMTHREEFVIAGLITLLAGGVTVCVGILLVLIYVWQVKHFQTDRTSPQRINSLDRASKVMILLLANFPVAILCTILGITLMSRH